MAYRNTNCAKFCAVRGPIGNLLNFPKTWVFWGRWAENRLLLDGAAVKLLKSYFDPTLAYRIYLFKKKPTYKKVE